MSNDNHIVIKGWMINELKLKGYKLLTFAIIYGFSQDMKSKMTGSLSYFQQALQVSRPTVVSILKSLTEDNLIQKNKIKDENGVRHNQYQVEKGVVKKFNYLSQANRIDSKNSLLPKNTRTPQDDLRIPTEGDTQKDENAETSTYICNRINSITKKEKKEYTSYIPKKTKKKPMTRRKTTINDKNKKYVPFAKQLAEAITTNKSFNINTSKNALLKWANHFRILNQTHKIDFNRIEKMLDWYCDHINDPFMPVIGTAETFKKKFLQIESAYARQNSKSTKITIGSRKNGNSQKYSQGVAYKKR